MSKIYEPKGKSQSPQAGQFNSYCFSLIICAYIIKSLNPLKRVNSILTVIETLEKLACKFGSQSPQAGQFNSYEV